MANPLHVVKQVVNFIQLLFSSMPQCLIEVLEAIPLPPDGAARSVAGQLVAEQPAH